MPIDLNERREIESLANFTANSAIAIGKKDILQLTQIIDDEIDQISNSQIIDGIDNILTTMRSEKERRVREVELEIGEQKKKWIEAPKATEDLIKESLRVFQDYFTHRFQDEENKPNLCGFDQDGVFAKNMIDHLKESPKECAGIMNSFCDYIAALSYLTNERIETTLKSFPPTLSEDINCLGGSGSDIDGLIKRLTVSKEDNDLFEIHQLLSTQIISRFSLKINDGNQKHIPPFLSFCLGVESEEVIMRVIKDPFYKVPRDEVTTHSVHSEIEEYFKSFKDHLKKNSNVTNDITTAALNKIRKFQKYDANDLALATKGTNDYDTRDTLSYEEGVPVTSLMKGEDHFSWDEEKITEHVVKTSLNRLFPEYPKKNIDKPSPEDKELLQRINNRSNLFTNESKEDLMAALKSNNNDLLSTGIRNLWLLGAKFKANSPILFTDIIDQLIDPQDGSVGIFTFADKDKKIIKINPEFEKNLTIADRDKLFEITEYYETHITSPDIIKYRNHLRRISQKKPLRIEVRNTLSSRIILALNGNASCEDIEKHVNAFQNRSFSDSSRYATQKQHQDDDIIFLNDITLDQVMGRADRLEILRKFKQSKIKLPEKTINKIYKIAISEQDYDLFQEYAHYHDPLSPTFLYNLGNSIARNDDKSTLFLLNFVEELYSNENKFRDYLRTINNRYRISLIHVAAAKGSVETIKFLHDHGVDLNNRNYFSNKNSRINITVKHGQTPAHVASHHGRTEVIKLLKKLGADLDQHDSYFNRPIHYAIKGGYNTTLEALIGDNDKDRKISLTRKPLSGIGIKHESSPAYIAAVNLRFKCLKTLIDQGLTLEAQELDRIARIIVSQISLKYPDHDEEDLILDNNKDILEFILQQGASTPYRRNMPAYIKDIIDRHDHFDVVARAIVDSAQNITKGLLVDGRELVKFKNKICKQLIETYNNNPENMLEDFKLTQNTSRETTIVRGNVGYEDLHRVLPSTFKINVSRKYQPSAAALNLDPDPKQKCEKIETLGEILGALLAKKIVTSSQQILNTDLSLKPIKLTISEERKESFIKILDSRESINLVRAPLKNKPAPKASAKKSGIFGCARKLQTFPEIEKPVTERS